MLKCKTPLAETDNSMSFLHIDFGVMRCFERNMRGEYQREDDARAMKRGYRVSNRAAKNGAYLLIGQAVGYFKSRSK